jgi:hypothetical protein
MAHVSRARRAFPGQLLDLGGHVEDASLREALLDTTMQPLDGGHDLERVEGSNSRVAHSAGSPVEGAEATTG